MIETGWKYEDIAWYGILPVSLEMDKTSGNVRAFGNSTLQQLKGWQNILAGRFFYDPDNGGIAAHGLTTIKAEYNDDKQEEYVFDQFGELLTSLVRTFTLNNGKEENVHYRYYDHKTNEKIANKVVIIWDSRIVDSNSDKDMKYQLVKVELNENGIATISEHIPFSNSSLATEGFIQAYYYEKGRNNETIKYIVVHYMAGKMTAKNCGYFFAGGTREASTHYGIGFDGKIAQYVDEKDTAYANKYYNRTAVSIETSNDLCSPYWTVSNKAYESLIRLVADIAKRNGLGKLEYKVNLLGHRDCCTTTTSPGPYLTPKLPEICKRANAINGYK